MKTIQVSDEDYETLMALSKELQLQPNDGNAFPYFWNAQSKKEVLNPHDEGEYTKIYFDCDSYPPEEFADEYIEAWIQFVREEVDEEAEDDFPYDAEYEQDWLYFIEKSDKFYGVFIGSYNLEYESDYNFSLFKEDVKGYIENNKHHLGQDPTTYARTIMRMPRMEKIVQALYRINPQEKELINAEALRFVYKEDK